MGPSKSGLGSKGDTTGEIVICTDANRNASEILQTVVHELVHAYDQTRYDKNLTKKERAACTEIRAYHLEMQQLLGHLIWYTHAGHVGCKSRYIKIGCSSFMVLVMVVVVRVVVAVMAVVREWW